MFDILHLHHTGLSQMDELKLLANQQKHILLTADDVDLALLSVRNTTPAGHTFSLAQHLFGRALRSDLPQLKSALEPFTPT